MMTEKWTITMNEKAQERIWKRDFDRDGYLYIPEFLTSEPLQELKNKINWLIKTIVPEMPSEAVYYEDIKRPETLKQIVHLHEQDVYFENMYYGSRFESLAAVLLGGEVNREANNSQYFNKPPKEGLATPPHQDGYYFKLDPCEALTMWLALEKVDEENGCVRYVQGSHLRGMRPHGRSGTLGFSQGITDYGTDEDRAHEKPLHAKAGDLLVHHAMMIHLAGSNTSTNRTRQAIGMIYYSQRAKPDHEANEAYQRKLNEELRAAGKI